MSNELAKLKADLASLNSQREAAKAECITDDGFPEIKRTFAYKPSGSFSLPVRL